MIVIVDYNVGNVKSVYNACERLGIETVISRDPEVINKAKGIILPGVGSFPVAMENLKKYELIDVLNERKKAGIPILGICLGMQILFEKGYEGTEIEGLGYLKGNVKEILTDKKLPHMGWNSLYRNIGNQKNKRNKNDKNNTNNTSITIEKNRITEYINEGDDVYFVHSYMADFIDENVIAYTEYGTTKIPAIVGKGNVWGCQFHPEKSGKVGEKILKAWKEMIAC